MSDQFNRPMAVVRALFVGPANCVQLTGLPWRHVRDHYRHLAISVGRKLVLPADALLGAIKQPAANDPDAGEISDPAAIVRAQLGVRRRNS